MPSEARTIIRNIAELIEIIRGKTLESKKQLFAQLRIELTSLKQATAKTHDLFEQLEEIIPNIENAFKIIERLK